MAKRKYVIRSAEGEYLTAYDNMSEVNTYLLHSYPGHTMQKPQGKKPQTLTVKDDEGNEVAFVDCPAAEDDK